MRYNLSKIVTRIVLFGDADINKTSASCYSVGATAIANNILNSKTMRFSLSGMLNNVLLSATSRLVVESVILPDITNITYQNVIIRLVSSTNDKIFDTKKLNAGNPIIFNTFTTAVDTIFYNATDTFYSMNINPNFLNNDIILELECISQQTTSIDFITNGPLNNFMINFVIVDIDNEQTKDPNLADLVKLNNQSNKLPIKQY